MTIAHNSILIKDPQGNFIFRKINSKQKTVQTPATQSEQQLEHQFKFKCAAAYARGAMHNPQKKAYYHDKANTLKLPNPYTAAIMDYMRKGKVKTIDVRAYKGRSGNPIYIVTEKKDFDVREVRVALYTVNGHLIESDSAQLQVPNTFIYRTKCNIPCHVNVILRVTLCDHIMNMTMKESLLTFNQSGALLE